ncbi:MAG: carboxymuconolactone decarboxylase family protein [Pseudomonadota bacterium]
MRLQIIEPNEATGKTKEIFQQLVMIPNVLCLIANSESVLDTYAQYHSSLPAYKLSEKNRNLISLAVSQFNDCSYCIALHTSSAIDSGILTKDECLDARRMKSTNPKIDAILKFTKAVLEKQGRINDSIIEAVKNQGFDDQQIIEIIAVISFITLANFTANVGEPELDFLEPPPIE